MDYKPVFKSEKGRQDILKIYDEVLVKWPVVYEELRVGTKLGSTYIIASGDKSAKPLILLHGTGSNSSMWIGDAAEYSKHFRVLAVDIPGEPGRSGEKQYPLESGLYSEWLKDVLDALGYEKACLAGISLGGWMAAAFAVNFPERVEKLALICPAGIGPQKITSLLWLIRLMFTGEKGYEKGVRRVVGGDDVPEEAIRYTKLMFQNFNYRTVVPVFSDKQLKRLDMSVLVLAGEKDVLLDTRKTVNRIRKLLPAADAALLPGTGHMLIHLKERIIEFLCR